jgi:hypothetical protein
MTDFDRWTDEIRQAVATDTSPEIPHELLEEGIEDPTAEGGWRYPCCRCGVSSPIMCDPTEFDPNYHYCGKDQFCCP